MQIGDNVLCTWKSDTLAAWISPRAAGTMQISRVCINLSVYNSLDVSKALLMHEGVDAGFADMGRKTHSYLKPTLQNCPLFLPATLSSFHPSECHSYGERLFNVSQLSLMSAAWMDYVSWCLRTADNDVLQFNIKTFLFLSMDTVSYALLRQVISLYVFIYM